MKINLFHDSFRIEYRSMFGAVPAGSALTLRLDVTGGDGFGVFLRLWDHDGEHIMSMQKEKLPNPVDPATCETTEQNYARYAAHFNVPNEGCLLWYYFVLKNADGRNVVYYGNNMEQLGGVGQQYDREPPGYQVTVYDRESKTPDWFKHAVVYQIFPDRFSRGSSETVTYQGKQAAVLHSCWDDKPYYCKNTETGEVVQYDFFGGNLAGIRDKLGYLKELGVTCLYLNPVFESHSNHRYDTGNYKQIDEFLGSNEEFAELCSAAREHGIRILLDGVFSHTGDDSIYFNRYNNYRSVGAFQSRESPYFGWYRFSHYPDKYSCWWGVDTLPEVEETTPSYMDYIINDEDSVLKHWLKAGISGWRLDVADELPPKFLKRFYQVLKETNRDAVLIGEVWEDASNKISYGETREYLCGGQLDGVMNYVLRNIMLDFVLGRCSAAEASQRYLHMAENYPPQNLYAMLNLLGSHDVERVLTLLQADASGSENVREYPLTIWEKQERVLEESAKESGSPWGEQVKSIVREVRQAERVRQLAEDRLNLLVTWQMTLPGAPCIYYGDEAGVEGGKDPDNRRTFPWRRIDTNIHDWYRSHIRMRRENDALRTGRYIPLYAEGDVLVYARSIEGDRDVFGAPAKNGTFIVALNRSSISARKVKLNAGGFVCGTLRDLVHGSEIPTRGGEFSLELPPLGVMVLTAETRNNLRRAGVLLHPTSLPAACGMGELGDSAYAFVDFLADAGQKVWQVLPLTPPGEGNSPYASPSAFAGSERLIALHPLVELGMLSPEAEKNFLAQCAELNAPDQEKIGALKFLTLRRMLRSETFNKKIFSLRAEYDRFVQRESYWLEDYALYRAIKIRLEGKPWFEWPKEIRERDPEALRRYGEVLADDIGAYKYLQFIFFTQWRRLKLYANSKGVKILGDMPIFVAHDSADVWAHQKIFQLDEAGRPKLVSGVPPDYFSAKGQLWGNPLYDWSEIAKTGYRWWIERLRVLGALADAVRIDHFRGFAACWAVEYGAQDAVRGRWIKSPGKEFFAAVRRELPDLHLIAEDLGVITPDVAELKEEAGLPGMSVMQFHCARRRGAGIAFDTAANCVAYTGTHDNSTLRGWYESDLTPEQREAVRQLVRLDEQVDVEEVVRSLIKYLYTRNAETVITPVQDLLVMDNGRRMNVPGTPSGNWGFTLRPDEFDMLRNLAPQLRELARATRR